MTHAWLMGDQPQPQNGLHTLEKSLRNSHRPWLIRFLTFKIKWTLSPQQSEFKATQQHFAERWSSKALTRLFRTSLYVNPLSTYTGGGKVLSFAFLKKKQEFV